MQSGCSTEKLWIENHVRSLFRDNPANSSFLIRSRRLAATSKSRFLAASSIFLRSSLTSRYGRNGIKLSATLVRRRDQTENTGFPSTFIRGRTPSLLGALALGVALVLPVAWLAHSAATACIRQAAMGRSAPSSVARPSRTSCAADFKSPSSRAIRAGSPSGQRADARIASTPS